jgi:hypothetical protein
MSGSKVHSRSPLGLQPYEVPVVGQDAVRFSTEGRGPVDGLWCPQPVFGRQAGRTPRRKMCDTAQARGGSAPLRERL